MTCEKDPQDSEAVVLIVPAYHSERIQIQLSKGKRRLGKLQEPAGAPSTCPLQWHCAGMRLLLPAVMGDSTCDMLSPRGAPWNFVSRVFIKGQLGRHAVSAYLTLATQSPAPQMSNWHSMAQGPSFQKPSFQAEYSKDSEVTSQELLEDLSWRHLSLARAGYEQPRPADFTLSFAVVVCVRLLSPSMLFWDQHVVACVSRCLPFLAEWYSLEWTHCGWFVHPSFSGHLGCFQF